jgi:CRISPR type IV-associated DEAD/DEAH-box helicase Csf4
MYADYNVLLTLSVTSGKTAELISSIEAALAAGLAPAPIPADAQRVSIRVSSTLMAELDRNRGGRAVSVYAAGLVAAWAKRSDSSESSRDDLSDFRPEQRRFAIEIDRRLTPGAQILAEGSTGLGKGLVITRLAGRATGLAIVAAPTIKTLSQNLNEYEKLRIAHDYPAARVFIGRRNFVSARRLRNRINEILEDRASTGSDDTPTVDVGEDRTTIMRAAIAARAWLETGATNSGPDTDDRAATLRAILPIGAYLTSDLRAVAPGFPTDEVILEPNEDPDDPGQRAYAEMRERVNSSEIGPIFTTHYAFILSNRFNRKRPEATAPVDENATTPDRESDESEDDDARRLLPTPDLLIVDEAHQLASSAESVFTMTIALSTLVRQLSAIEPWRSLRMQTRAVEAAREVAAIAERMIDVFAVAKDYSIADTRSSLRPLARELLDHINKLTARKKIPVTPETRIIFDAREIAKRIVSTSADYSVKIDASPVYRFPSLAIGPSNLYGFFTRMWERIDQVVFVSATIYVPRSRTTPTSPLMTTLYLDPKRVAMAPAIMAPWLHTGVTLRTAYDEPTLRPPAADATNYVEEMESWHRRIADHVREIWRTARGGTLVLLTSYDSIDALQQLLDPEQNNPAIIAQRRGRFPIAEAAFRTMYAAGRKPLWLATAQAWTGMDLRDTRLGDDGKPVDVSKDFLFTDLIVPRVPFGTEQSRIHQARYSRSVWNEWDRAAMQFRQGIGRLIRAEGLRERRLFVLDGRIWDPAKAAMMEPYKLMLAPYRSSP